MRLTLSLEHIHYGKISVCEMIALADSVARVQEETIPATRGLWPRRFGNEVSTGPGSGGDCWSGGRLCGGFRGIPKQSDLGPCLIDGEGNNANLLANVRRTNAMSSLEMGSRVAPRASLGAAVLNVRIPGSSARHTRWQRTRGKRLCGRCWRGPAAVRHWRERSLSGRREALNSHRDKQGGRGQLPWPFRSETRRRCAHGLLVTAGAEPRTLITREAINMPPPRRMQNPQSWRSS